MDPALRRRLELALLLVVAGCTGAAADHEKLGDRAYVDGRFRDALVEYRLAIVQHGPSVTLRTKAGHAALNAMELAAAAHEYIALGEEGGSDQLEEAADGLVRVANFSIEERDQEALALALDGLQRIAPGRALGSFAGHLASSIEGLPQSSDGLALVTFAAAGAANARTQDSLMFVYAAVMRRTGRCGRAAIVFESLARRARDAEIAENARHELALCSLEEGVDALDQGKPAEAEGWFRRAVAGTGNVPAARVAYIGLGDVRLVRGDYLGAAEAYLRAMDGLLPGDSIYDMASARLNAIADAARPVPG